jgi:hypothetical protein
MHHVNAPFFLERKKERKKEIACTTKENPSLPHVININNAVWFFCSAHKMEVIQLGPVAEVEFKLTTVEEGRAALGAKDDFIKYVMEKGESNRAKVLISFLRPLAPRARLIVSLVLRG